MNKDRNSVSVNALLSGIRTLLSVIFPLITYPYAARILQVEKLGIVNFSASIIGYFTLMAGLGISTYAVRQGVSLRDDKDLLSHFSSEIFSINIISTFITYIFLFLLILFVPKFYPYRLLMLVQSLTILGNLIGVSWIYSIEEDFLYITIRSIFVYIFALIILFLFVKTPQDYIWYAGATVISNVGANIYNFFHSKKFIRLKICFDINWKKHFKPIMILFAASVAATIYVNSDKTLLGLIVGENSVGLYSIAVEIYTILKTMFSAIMLVVLPRAVSYVSTNKIDSYIDLARMSLNSIFILLIPVICGIIVTSKEVVLLIGGKSYLESVPSVIILSLSLLFSVFAIYTTNMALLPNKQEKINLIASIISAIINITFNLFLLRFFQQNGAAFTTLIAEAFMFFYQLYYSNKYIHFSIKKENIRDALIGSLGIILGAVIIDMFHLFYLIGLIIKIICGVFVYFLVLTIFKNEILVYIINKIIKKLKKIGNET